MNHLQEAKKSAEYYEQHPDFVHAVKSGVHALIAIAEQLERINPPTTFLVGVDGKSYCTHCGKEEER